MTDDRAHDPTRALNQLLSGGPVNADLYPPNSRYHGARTKVYQPPGGEPVVYLERRFVPPPEAYASQGEHPVTQGERRDHLAAQTLGDPELAWRLADANRCLDPAELTATIGRRLRIPLPAGVPAGPDDV